jgi:hypothetical protein
VDSRVRDVKEYRSLQLAAYHSATRDLGSGERVLVLGEPRYLHGLKDGFVGRRSALVQEVESRIVYWSALTPDERTTDSLARRGVRRVPIFAVDCRFGGDMMVTIPAFWRWFAELLQRRRATSRRSDRRVGVPGDARC